MQKNNCREQTTAGGATLSFSLRRMRELRGSKHAHKYTKRASWHKLALIKSLKQALRDLGNMRNFALCCWVMHTARTQPYTIGPNSIYLLAILQCEESPLSVFINNCAVRNTRDNCFWFASVFLEIHLIVISL